MSSMIAGSAIDMIPRIFLDIGVVFLLTVYAILFLLPVPLTVFAIYTSFTPVPLMIAPIVTGW